ncbi:hypothetical protein CHISP_0928 [Chitinispirillum alkaliphilum]|nr:hypothetical protein CHISP_0928 [Chitinispirillum alkaliphilum]
MSNIVNLSKLGLLLNIQKHASLLFVFFFIFAAGVNGKETENHTSKGAEMAYIRLRASCFKTSVDVYINGVLIESNLRALSRTLSVNQWAINGENTVRVVISQDTSQTNDPAGQSFEMEILMYREPELKETTVGKIEWTGEDDTVFPVIVEKNITFDIPYGDWIWQDADILNEENLDRESLTTFIETIHTMLSQKDYTGLSSVLSVKTRELARAYGFSIEERLEDQSSFFNDELFSDPLWNMQPLNPNEFKITYHAQGRLIEITDQNGNTPLESVSLESGIVFSLNLFLCQKSGQWILCR